MDDRKGRMDLGLGEVVSRDKYGPDIFYEILKELI